MSSLDQKSRHRRILAHGDCRLSCRLWRTAGLRRPWALSSCRHSTPLCHTQATTPLFQTGCTRTSDCLILSPAHAAGPRTMHLSQSKYIVAELPPQPRILDRRTSHHKQEPPFTRYCDTSARSDSPLLVQHRKPGQMRGACAQCNSIVCLAMLRHSTDAC